MRLLAALATVLALGSLAPGIAAPAFGAGIEAPTSATAPVRISRYKIVRHGPLDMALLSRQAAAGLTTPFWTHPITSPLDHRTYSISMVGSSPYATAKSNVVAPFVPIMLRVHFKNGMVFDPTKPAVCDAQGQSAQARLLASPMFFPATFTSNGVNVSAGVASGTQLGSAFQRANFWSQVKGTNYGVTVRNARATPIVADINAPAGSSIVAHGVTCAGKLRTINEAILDDAAFSADIDALALKYASPGALVMIITYNVDTPQALGFHSAEAAGSGTQTYLWTSWFDPGVVPPDQDISVLVHEIGEWLDDPFVQSGLSVGQFSDATPNWNNGSGCQNDLEVGDPLGSRVYPVTGGGGFTYHFPDLAFHDWFYRTPSTSTGGRFSFQGEFRSVQGVC